VKVLHLYQCIMENSWWEEMLCRQEWDHPWHPQLIADIIKT